MLTLYRKMKSGKKAMACRATENRIRKPSLIKGAREQETGKTESESSVSGGECLRQEAL